MIVEAIFVILVAAALAIHYQSEKLKSKLEEKVSEMYASTSAPAFGLSTMREVLPDNEAILYELYLVYAENLNNPTIIKKHTIARSEEDAKIKSGILKEVDDAWDMDYLSLCIKRIGVVKFKKKPTEVKVIT